MKHKGDRPCPIISFNQSKEKMHKYKGLLASLYIGLASTLISTYTAEGGGARPTFDDVRALTVDHMAEAGLNVRTDNGAITVKRFDRNDVEITAYIRCVSPERLEAVEIIAEREHSGTLKIYAKWPGGKRKNKEGCSFEVLLPDARDLELRTANGAITAEGFSGTASLKTSNGKITVHAHDGSVDVSTSNGAVDLTAINGTVKATTSNGRISARDINGGVELRTSNGAIHAVGVTSPVNAHTSNGSISLELATGFAGEMTASTSNGSLDINGLDKAKLISSGKKRIVFAVGDTDHKSSASTSNGSLRIRMR